MALRLLYPIFCRLIDWLALLAARRPGTPRFSFYDMGSWSCAGRSPGYGPPGRTALPPPVEALLIAPSNS